jgi:hypothetical protein
MLSAGVPYKIFIARSHVRVKKKDDVLIAVQRVTMLAWRASERLDIEVKPPSLADLELGKDNQKTIITTSGDGPAQASGLAQPNESPLTFGGAAWTNGDGLKGSIGPIRFYSAAIKTPLAPTVFCKPHDSERSRIGAWSFKDAESVVLTDDMGRNHGKLKNDPDGVLSK